MGWYAYLVCEPCEVVMHLGKPVRPYDDELRVDYFHLGGDIPNSAQPAANRSLWKFTAEHGRHGMRVLFDDYDSSDWVDIGERSKAIGGDREDGDIPYEDYVENWQG